jgi:hypothetical protein
MLVETASTVPAAVGCVVMPVVKKVAPEEKTYSSQHSTSCLFTFSNYMYWLMDPSGQ